MSKTFTPDFVHNSAQTSSVRVGDMLTRQQGQREMMASSTFNFYNEMTRPPFIYYSKTTAGRTGCSMFIPNDNNLISQHFNL